MKYFCWFYRNRKKSVNRSLNDYEIRKSMTWWERYEYWWFFHT